MATRKFTRGARENVASQHKASPRARRKPKVLELHGHIRPPVDGIPDRIRQIRTLIQAARIVNDKSISPSILIAAKRLIVDAQRRLAGGAA